jgi:hypothetical protein
MINFALPHAAFALAVLISMADPVGTAVMNNAK